MFFFILAHVFLFFWAGWVDGGSQGGAVKRELKHEPVSTRVKLKILPHLLRSRLAAECFPANIQVTYWFSHVLPPDLSHAPPDLFHFPPHWSLWCASLSWSLLSFSCFSPSSTDLSYALPSPMLDLYDAPPDWFSRLFQVVYDGLFGANTNAKLLSLSLQFVHHICLM